MTLYLVGAGMLAVALLCAILLAIAFRRRAVHAEWQSARYLERMKRMDAEPLAMTWPENTWTTADVEAAEWSFVEPIEGLCQ